MVCARSVVAVFVCAVVCLAPATIVGVGGNPVAAPTQDYPLGFQINRDNWEIPVEPGRSIKIENLHGDVRARRNEVPRLDIFVVIQLQDQDPLRADVQIIETAEGLKVDVRYVPKEADGQIEEANEQTGEAARQAEAAGEQMEIIAPAVRESDFIRRVDMVVYVPAGSGLDIRTTDGTIEARKLKSDVVAETIGGEVTIITEGLARARSESGSILAVLLSDAPARPSLLVTKTGHIRLQVPNDLNVLVQASTAGVITSEHTAEMSGGSGTRRREAVARVGAGTYLIEIESDTGDIDILAWERSTGDRDSGREGRRERAMP